VGRDHLRMSTLEDNMLLILNMIFRISSLASSQPSHVVEDMWVVPSNCLIAKGLNMESELGTAANDIKGEVKEHVFGKWVRRTYSQGPVCRLSAPLVVS